MSAAAHRRRKAQGTHDSVCSTPAGQHAHVYVCVTHRLSLAMRLLRDAQGTLYRKVNCDECNWQLWPVGAQLAPVPRTRPSFAHGRPNVSVCVCVRAATGAPTMVKITLAKQKPGSWKALLSDDDKKNS